nr:uncharacterized protein LOC124220478 [Neodiprion pinetum]
MGVSAKYIRILKDLYGKAHIRIKTPEGLTDRIDITEGVLQGEILSPLLFILFIADMEEYFREEGLYGTSLNILTDVLLLLYADDLAIIANNKADVAKKLKILHKYCEKNGLTVNVDKSYILYCRKAGKIPKNIKFYYNAKNIEIVSNFTYLGIPISASGRGRLAMTSAISKARTAIGAVNTVIYKARMYDFDSINTLFDSMISSIALYAAPVWALRYINEIDSLTTEFYKKILCIKRTTPNNLVKYEQYKQN